MYKRQDPTGIAFQVGDISINDKASVAPLIKKLRPIIEGLFVWPWTSFLAATAAHARALQVQEFVDTTLKDSATEDTAMDLKETANNGAELNQAIAAVTRQKTEHLQKQIDQLTQQLRSVPKNLPSGAGTTTAATQKVETLDNRDRMAKKPAQPPTLLLPPTPERTQLRKKRRRKTSAELPTDNCRRRF